MTSEEVIAELESLSNPKAVEGMAKFGVGGAHTLGISIPILRAMAKRIGKNHGTALKLWESGIHEARILASMVEEPDETTEKQMEAWAAEFDSWDVTDQCCMNLFEKMPSAWEMAVEWSSRKEEFVKRSGFVLMARLAVSDKKAEDSRFLDFFPYIFKESTDERNFVKKAVNWAVRQIGKRNALLNRKAVALAREIQKLDSKSAQWIAGDALRELTDPKVLSRLNRKKPIG